ncbi:phosphotransferase [Halarcobacter sp.]|uniref:phosphotransferase n=1 Tax=Halarcobacter sp. TaxID=2321133 RepID=UPI0029F4B1F0|nr:phosphotransferase [Halarcobacter sp.]
MGVLTKLTLKEVNSLIEDTNICFNSIQETFQGISDTTYIGTSDTKKYVFKLYEDSSIKDIENQIKILKAIKTLDVPNVLSKKINLYNNRPITLLSYIEGDVIQTITSNHLKQITLFLVSLHSIKEIEITKKDVYSKQNFEKMLYSLKNIEEIKQKYKIVKDIDLKPNALIHGDLFPDNVKFIDEKLSGVYDFTQSCFGNINFDIAVVVISWCFDKDIFNKSFYQFILNTYDRYSKIKIEKENFKQYLLYACLYYSLQRVYKNTKKDCTEFLRKFEIINETI